MRSESKLIFILCANVPVALTIRPDDASSAEVAESSFVKLVIGVDPLFERLSNVVLMVVRTSNEIYCTFG
jgi:hypothetical protein